MESVKHRETPWCTITLVVLACSCHLCVLTGNLKTANAFAKIGQSTSGWSGVGLGLSHSLRTELDHVMTNMTEMLTDSINHTLFLQDLLETVVALAGNATDSLMHSDAAKAVFLLQEHVGSKSASVDKPLGFAVAIMHAVDQVLDQLMVQVHAAIGELMKKIKPALEKVGEFMIKFGDQIQNVISGFSVTLDRVQKLFDQVMASMVGGGTADIQAEMRHNTFTLYDVSNTGYVNPTDLKNVAKLYGVPALQGKKSDELIKKYDQDGDLRLDREEYALFVEDPDLPNAMAVVLRSYAKRLSEVAGNVAAAKFRDEIATSVVNYLELVCAKNQTKVGWIADALSNGSLPLEFTADIMAELALQMDEPDRLTTSGVGRPVISKMLELNQEHTISAYKLLANATYWVAEGYDPEDQAICLKRLSKWVPDGKALAALLDVSSEYEASATMGQEELDDMLSAAQRSGEQNMKAVLELQEVSRDIAHSHLFESKSAQSLLIHALGGSMMAAEAGSAAERTIKAGVPAKPETLLFAKRLAYNASATAQRFQKMCFDSTSQSSNAADSFATQIHGMVKKIQGFIQMMEKYATPAGIQQLEDQASNFTEKAADDLMKIVKKEVGTRFNQSADKIDAAVDGAIKSATGTFAGKIGEILGNPLAKSLSPTVADILGELVGNETATKIAEKIGHILGGEIGKVSSQELEQKLNDLMAQLVRQALADASEKVDSTLGKLPRWGGSLLQMPRDILLEEDVLSRGRGTASFGMHSSWDAGAQLSGVWDGMTTMLKSLVNLLPQATNSLKFARKEVSKLSANLDSLFEVFSVKGLGIFEQVSKLWRTIWLIYYFFVSILTLTILFYAFWAGGFFGGPGSSPEESQEAPAGGPEPSEDEKLTWSWRLRTCCSTCCTSCCHCMIESHDTHLFFWSFVLLLQLIVLLVFIVTTLLCLLAALKLFIASSCGQIYVLGDATLCGQTMKSIRSWLATFLSGVATDELQTTCMDQHLLTCQLIGHEMAVSSIITTVFGGLGCLLYFQIMIESAMLHTRAVYRRKIAKMKAGS